MPDIIAVVLLGVVEGITEMSILSEVIMTLCVTSRPSITSGKPELATIRAA
jgi:hypothetical protein